MVHVRSQSTTLVHWLISIYLLIVGTGGAGWSSTFFISLVGYVLVVVVVVPFGQSCNTHLITLLMHIADAGRVSEL